MIRGLSIVVSLLVVGPAPLRAQPSGTPAPLTADERREVDAKADAIIEEVWKRALAGTASARPTALQGLAVAGDATTRRQVYQQALDAMEPELERRLGQLLRDNPRYAQAVIDEHADVFVARAVAERLSERAPVSTNAPASNPLTAGLAERSGATTLAALAADLTNGFFNADGNAITLNLSALALVGLGDQRIYSSIASYQRHSLARRLTGSVTFGAKVPEKDITGLSNLPDFDTLLDVFVWDVKVRVLGDKDPRSRRWFERNLFITQLAAVLPNKVATSLGAAGVEENTMLAELTAVRVQRHLRELRAAIASSPQVSVKVAGTHLTKEAGRNKYAVAAFYDQGVGQWDLTANVQYAVTDDIRLGVDKLFQTKAWSVAGAATAHLAPDAVVAGRSIDLSLGAHVLVFADRDALPVEVQNVWKLTSSLEFPVKGGGKIPVSVIYTNDPNALVKEKYVTGLVGFSYDFSALGALFKPR